MGIVHISDPMHQNLRIASNALCRSINAQAEHWMRIGMLAELHPELCHGDICQLLVRSRLAGGEELAFATQPTATTPGSTRKSPERPVSKPVRAASR